MAINTIAAMSAIVLIAIKEFPVFKQLTDKWKLHRQARLQAKVAKSEANKQKRIEKLEAELKDLKKDE